jgi:hypothetical protein
MELFHLLNVRRNARDTSDEIYLTVNNKWRWRALQAYYKGVLRVSARQDGRTGSDNVGRTSQFSTHPLGCIPTPLRQEHGLILELVTVQARPLGRLA